MKTVLYPVNELRVGGAEQQLLELVRGLDKSRFRPIVAPLYRGGGLDGEFAAVDGAEVVHLDRRGKYDPSTLWRMAAELASQRKLPARAVTCMEHALELEFRDLPAVVDLQSIRNEYGQLLAQYCDGRAFAGAGQIGTNPIVLLGTARPDSEADHLIENQHDPLAIA